MNLLLEETATSSSNNGSQIWVWVIFAVMIVAMIFLTVIPNKKRQKEYQKMQDEMRVGTKVMTIGRMIGIITKLNSDNTIELDVGTAGNPVIITINREAIAINLTAQEAAKAQKEEFEAKKRALREGASESDAEVAEVAEEAVNAEENVEDAIEEASKDEEVVAEKKHNPQIKDEDDAI